jgi:DNA repair protein SbcC/Rad50
LSVIKIFHLSTNKFILAMQLTLKNFKHYGSASFTFPTNGMTLFYGKTRAGKSTIFAAIAFAFYGKIRRPCSHGSKSCTVKLYDPVSDLNITRSRTPNRLLVIHKNITYEDNAAQGVIEQVLGMTNFEFLISSYFDQRKQSSILSMSPAEQLEFVEELAFNADNNECEEIKNKTRAHVKNLENSRTEIKAKFDYVKEQVKKGDDELSSTYANCKFPENFNSESVKTQHSNVVKEFQKIQAELENKRSVLEKIRKDEIEYQKIEKEKLALETKLQLQLERKKQILGSDTEPKSEEDINKLSLDVERIRKTIQQLKDADQADKLQKDYDEQLKQHNISLEKQVLELKAKILDENKLQEIQSQLSCYEQDKIAFENYEKETARINSIQEEKKRATEKLDEIKKDIIIREELKTPQSKKGLTDLPSFIKKNITVIEKQISILETKIKSLENKNTVHSCPKCKTTFIIDEGRVVEFDGANNNADDGGSKGSNCVEQNVSQLQSALSDYKKKHGYYSSILPTVTSLKEKIVAVPKLPKAPKTPMSLQEFQQLSEQISAQKYINESINSLHNQPVPASILRIQSQCVEKRKGLPKNLDRSQNISDIESKVKNLEIAINDAWKAKGEYSKVTREISIIEKNLNELLKRSQPQTKSAMISGRTNDSKSLHDSIKTLESTSKNVLKKMNELTIQLELAHKYDIFCSNKSNFEQLKRAEADLNAEYAKINNRIQGAYDLDYAAREANLLVLEEVIENINAHAKFYLDTLFSDSDNEMSVELAIKTTTKKGEPSAKPSIEVVIEYKGHTDYDLEDLCGGERQLCDLAFLLGVNDMMGSNIILLDECFNNLDAGTNMEVLEYLRELYDKDIVNKRIFIISHEAIEGIFHEVVDVEKL